MREKTLIALCTVAAIILVAAISAWRYSVSKDRHQHVHAYLYDQSKSKIDGCSCLKEQARRQMDDPEAAGAKLLFFVLGTRESGYQPKVIATYEVPESHKVLDGRDEPARKKESILLDLEKKCQAVTRTDETPLFQGVKAVIEQMRAEGCVDAKSGCSLFAQTDLEDTVTLNRPVASGTEAKRASEVKVPEKIDNTGISVTFSGVSEMVVTRADSKGRALRKLDGNDRWRSIWTQVFTVPENVRFEPMCPRASENTAKN